MMRCFLLLALGAPLFINAQSVSKSGRCGSQFDGLTCRGSTFGNCCSQYNYCGTTTGHCGSGCQSGYGTCSSSAPPATPKVTTDGSCGGSKGSTCQGSVFGNCCSKHGYCGKSAAYCGDGCNAKFGSCSSLPAASSTKVLITTSTQSASSSKSSPTQIVSTNTRCGYAYDATGGMTCAGSKWGQCCSQYSYCGSTDAYCGKGCQSGFGQCSPSSQSASSTSTSTEKKSLSSTFSSQILSSTSSSALTTLATSYSSSASVSSSSLSSSLSSSAATTSSSVEAIPTSSSDLISSSSSSLSSSSLSTSAATTSSSVEAIPTSSSDLITSSSSSLSSSSDLISSSSLSLSSSATTTPSSVEAITTSSSDLISSLSSSTQSSVVSVSETSTTSSSLSLSSTDTISASSSSSTQIPSASTSSSQSTISSSSEVISATIATSIISISVPTSDTPSSSTTPSPVSSTSSTVSVCTPTNTIAASFNPSFETGNLAPWSYTTSTSFKAPGSVLSTSNAPYPPNSGDYAFYITAQEGVGTNNFISARLINIPFTPGSTVNCTLQLYINPSNPASNIIYNPRLYITNALLAGGNGHSVTIKSTNGRWMTLGGLVTIPAGVSSTFAILQIGKSTSGKAGDYATIGADNLVCYPLDGSQCAGATAA